MADLYTLLHTENYALFEQETKNWPGVEKIRTLIWNCVCDDPECFRHCVQGFSTRFPTEDLFVEWLKSIEQCQNVEDVSDCTVAFCKLHKIRPSRLLKKWEMDEPPVLN